MEGGNIFQFFCSNKAAISLILEGEPGLSFRLLFTWLSDMGLLLISFLAMFKLFVVAQDFERLFEDAFVEDEFVVTPKMAALSFTLTSSSMRPVSRTGDEEFVPGASFLSIILVVPLEVVLRFRVAGADSLRNCTELLS